MIRLIAADVDGTLVKDHDTITDLTLKAIKEACKEGLKFVICSGRNYYEMKENMIDFYGLDAMAVCENGALIFDESGKEIFCHLLTRDKKENILSVLKKYPVLGYSHIREGICTYISMNQYEQYYKEFRKGITDEKDLIAADRLFKIFAADMKFDTPMEEMLEVDTLKMEAIFVRHDLYKELWNELLPLGLEVTSAGTSNNIEVMDPSCSKAKALMEVSSMAGISIDEVAVFGDGLNDLSLFRTFKETYAMENACKEIKEIARYHTTSCNEDGVGKGILKILEENSK